MNHCTLPTALPNHPAWVCVLHSHAHLHQCALHYVALPGVKFITGMADLMECEGALASLWIDARMAWNSSVVHLLSIMTVQKNLAVYIYNSACLPALMCDLKHPQLKFIEGEISLEMLL